MPNKPLPHITASKLYDYLQCPHKVWRDLYGPQEEKIRETNPFVQMLWEKGVAHEKDIVAGLGEMADLGSGSHETRFRATMAAIQAGAPLIYQGVLKRGRYVGIPDLLRRMPDGRYLPVDIKSGAGFEGSDDADDDEGKPKKHYAIQLCLYVELLQILGIPNTGNGRIIDGRGREVAYDLETSIGKRSPLSWWDFYNQTRQQVQALMDNQAQNKPAMSGTCKLCPWYKSCRQWCKANEDLTEIFYLGRSKRDLLCEELGIDRVCDICDIDIEEIMQQKKKDRNFLRGVGRETIDKIVRRAIIISRTKQPVAYKKLEFPPVSYELFFDIEDDPTQEFVYMHGVYERNGNREQFRHFTAEDNTREAEKQAWARFWDYIRSLPKDDFAVYYYSHHEKTTYRKMQRQYPDVVSAEEVEDFFSHPNTIDLYQVVYKYTDWPVGSYSLKEIAQYLGFSWRDKTPSGALSIQWFNEYLETKDPKKLERILLYNEDDCIATMVIKDGISRLEVVDSE